MTLQDRESAVRAVIAEQVMRGDIDGARESATHAAQLRDAQPTWDERDARNVALYEHTRALRGGW